MEFSYGLIPVGLFAAILLIFSAAGVGMVLKVIEKRTKTRIHRWFFFTGTLTFISIVAFIIIGHIQHLVTDYRAEKIVYGLEQYYADKGMFPDNLGILTSDYLERVPPTAYGVLRQDFEYTKSSPDKFELHYYSYLGVEHWYDSKIKEWRVDD